MPEEENKEDLEGHLSRKPKSTPANESETTTASSLVPYPSPVGEMIDNNYLIERHFNTEIFRNLYLGLYDENNQAKWMFIKMKHTKFPDECKFLALEYETYKYLNNIRGVLHVAKPLKLGNVLCYKALVMELLGPNLNDLWALCDRRLSIRALAQLGYQLVCLMKYFHERGLIFLNIRPECFVYGQSGHQRWTWLYAVDLKYCKFWCQCREGGRPPIHIPFRRYNNPIHVGTPIRFMSINAHKGKEQSRRDDLESIGYLLVYLYRGHLPWMDYERISNEEERNNRILQSKENSLYTLCQNMLPEFERYMVMVRSLKFFQQPDYQSLGRLFLDVQRLIGYQCIYDLYDWDHLHQPFSDT